MIPTRRCPSSANLLLVAMISICSTSITALAWNGTGHKAIALIAYEKLTSAARKQIDNLLAKHPDYPKWTDGVPARQKGSTAFLEASVWPDAIRNDPRFHNDKQPATPPIPGLPESAQARHAGWHFINVPFSIDGTPTTPPEEPNALTKLKDFQALGRMPEQMQVYTLPWLIHLVADVHQPLHVIDGFSKEHPKGDLGGNTVRLKDGSNLHAYWDGRLGSSQTARFIDDLAATIEQQNPRPQKLDMDPRHWVDEGVALRQQVYSFTGAGTTQNPAVLSDQYSVEARRISFQRAALAAYRLAEFLNDQLH